MKRGEELDKLVAIEVFGRKEGDDYLRFSSNMADAMLAANKVELFNKYALHRFLGVYSQEWGWYVSEIDSRGVLQGFVYADDPETTICLACLKLAKQTK